MCNSDILILKDKLIFDKVTFDKKNEWARWIIIDKILNKKGVNNPGLWLKQRKQILGLAN